MGKHICPICDDKDGKGFAAGRGRWIKVAITSLIIDEDPQQNEEVALNTIPDVAAELAKTAAWWNAFLQPPNDDFMINQDEHSLDGLTPRLACNDERCRKRLRREIHNQLKNIREAHLEWIDSTIGLNNELIRPFTPIVVDKTQRTLDILGRRITLGKNGIPAQYASFFSGSNTKIIKSGRDAFAMPPRFDCLVAGKALTWKTTSFDFTKTTPAQVEWTAKSASGPVLQAVTGRLEFDGTLKLQVEFFGQTRDTIFDDIWFVVPWAKDVVKYSTGLGMQAGVCPESYRWHWDASNHHQDAVWLGDANIGAMLRFKGGNYQRRAIEGDMPRRPWRVPDSWGAGGMHIEKKDGETTLTAFSGPKTLQVGRNRPCRKLHFNIDWHFTPFKSLDTRKHFSDRYYHDRYGASFEHLEAIKKEGVNVINIDHNHSPDDDGNDSAYLFNIIKTAHSAGVQVDVYYGTHRLSVSSWDLSWCGFSYNLDLDLDTSDHPSTDQLPPYYYFLQRHIGYDLAAAWRKAVIEKRPLGNLSRQEREERLSLLISGWDNFYLEGLNFLVKKVGIDGIYIDNTALGRESMQRARRILDMDASTARRISMHLFSRNDKFNWANGTSVFMELYPYYDRLRCDKSFDANHSPEFMLVEMSGIPYGLMGEMLLVKNIWHGMVFGMICGWSLCDDPRPIWKIIDLFGIADSEFIGWWDPACPAKCDNPLVKVSVYRKAGKSMIALASWLQKEEIVKLVVDWNALGLDPDKTTLWSPESEGFHARIVFPTQPQIPILAKNSMGWLLIADENPHERMPISPYFFTNTTSHQWPDDQQSVLAKEKPKTPRGRPKRLLNKDLLPAIEEAIKALGSKAPERRKLLAMRCAIRTTWDNAVQEHMISRTELMAACRAFRQRGTDGLKAKKHPGKKRKLTPEQESQLKNWVDTRCDGSDKTKKWTLKSLVAKVKTTFGVCYSQSGMLKVLARLELNEKAGMLTDVGNSLPQCKE